MTARMFAHNIHDDSRLFNDLHSLAQISLTSQSRSWGSNLLACFHQLKTGVHNPCGHQPQSEQDTPLAWVLNILVQKADIQLRHSHPCFSWASIPTCPHTLVRIQKPNQLLIWLLAARHLPARTNRAWHLSLTWVSTGQPTILCQTNLSKISQ